MHEKFEEEITSAILSNRANRSFKILTSSCADVLLANSVNPCKNSIFLCDNISNYVFNSFRNALLIEPREASRGATVQLSS